MFSHICSITIFRADCFLAQPALFSSNFEWTEGTEVFCSPDILLQSGGHLAGIIQEIKTETTGSFA
jgi:hypothetical protein